MVFDIFLMTLSPSMFSQHVLAIEKNSCHPLVFFPLSPTLSYLEGTSLNNKKLKLPRTPYLEWTLQINKMSFQKQTLATLLEHVKKVLHALKMLRKAYTFETYMLTICLKHICLQYV
jgi:hypothetical protein